MSIEDIFQGSADRDPTWTNAYSIVKEELQVPAHVARLFKAGWIGESDQKEYLKVLGFSRLNPSCLMTAAELDMEQLKENGVGAISHAISFLGVRLTATVLAINLTNRIILKSKPPVGWKSLMKEMMTDIEIGYRIGSKVSEVGVEGGAMIGFARHAGLGLLMASNPRGFKKYQSLLREKPVVSADEEAEVFSCAIYQVSAFILQQLGFGSDLAMGIALGAGGLDGKLISVEPEVLRWKATYHWIDCLRKGQNFPRNPEMRDYFGILKPPKKPERNLNLEALYAEIAKTKKDMSLWTWHLPKPSYEQSAELFGLV